MDIAARRTGDAVAITFTIPSANIDESKPADIGRVDVYAYTAMAQNDVRDPRRMTLVGYRAGPADRGAEPEDATAKKPGPPPPPEPGEDQGALVTVTETLTADDAGAAGARREAARRPVQAEPVSWFGTPRGAAAGRSGADSPKRAASTSSTA